MNVHRQALGGILGKPFVLKIGPEGTTVEGDGIPNAQRVVRVRTQTANHVADLDLHLNDLTFALQCVDLLATQTESVTRDALWEGAIVHFFKVFMKDFRLPLDPQKVWSDEPKGLEDFTFFRHLRNKHLIHDENAYVDCVTGAVITDRSTDRRVAAVFTLALRAETVDGAHQPKLRPLIERAHSWVGAERDAALEQLMTELRAESYDVLEQLEPLVLPSVGDNVHVRRLR